MKLIFVGSVYPQYLLDYLVESGRGIDYAANNYQHALLEGFSSFFNEIQVVTSPPVGNPKLCNRGLLSPRLTFKEGNCHQSFYYVGTRKSNRLARMLSEFIRIRKALGHIIRESNASSVICSYSLHSPFLLAVLTLKKRVSKVCVIIPDLPEYMSESNTILRILAKKIDRLVINLCLYKMDCFVLLSKAMVNKLPIKDKQWTIVEGIYRPIVTKEADKIENKKIILYTGQLQKRYGVFDLVEAFMLIPEEDYELWLCGGTNDLKWFEQRAKIDKRIRLLGRVPTEEAVALQKRATLLINPRHSNEEFTKYSFPSKTMEYMASGTPTLMCKLPSIPEEYYDYLFFFDDESILGMKNKIMEVCGYDSSILRQKGEKASEFIKKNKNPQSQVGRIVKLIEGSNNNSNE